MLDWAIRLVKGPCSETQASATRARGRDGKARMWRALTHTLPLRGAFPSERLRAATRRMPGERSVSAGTAAAHRGGL